MDTVAKLASWEPNALRAMLVEFVERTGFDGVAPLPKEVAFSVLRASELPSIVEESQPSSGPALVDAA